MGKRSITVTGSSFDDLISSVESALPTRKVLKEAMKARVRVGEEATKRAWVSMVPNAWPNDFVYDSISHKAEYASHNNTMVYGSFGVYGTDWIKTRHGRDNKSVSAPQIAYWTEFGTINTPAAPFLMNAFYASMEEQERVFIETINRLSKKG